MKTFELVLRGAPFLGLVAMVLPGCPSRSPEQAFCEKMVECGKDANVTAQQCQDGLAKGAEKLQNSDLCRPLLEPLQALMLCAAEQMSCEELENPPPGGLSEGDPCYEATQDLADVMMQGGEQGAATMFACLLDYTSVLTGIAGAPEQGSGEPCTDVDDCPVIDCPAESLGAGGAMCAGGRCGTAADLCK